MPNVSPGVSGFANISESGISNVALKPSGVSSSESDAFDLHPASFALVGMAGFLASCNRIPIAAIVLVSEISGNHQLLLPAMWVCCISFWINNGWTLYRSQLGSRRSAD